jgi:hypothetical protein
MDFYNNEDNEGHILVALYNYGDEPVTLDYQGLEYELIPQPNGNFSTEQSNASEVF